MADLVSAPGGFVPQQALAFGDRQAVATAVSWTAGMPIESAAPGTAATTIATGGSLGGVIDLDRQRLHAIGLPASWTAAAISFQGSIDGAAFADLYDRDGEVTLPAASVAAGRIVVVDPVAFMGMRWLKLRSGTAAAPVMQAEARAITLVTVPR